MSALPHEARDGLMRAWLYVLRDRHPEVTWVPADQATASDHPNGCDAEDRIVPLAATT
jgi:hypothetical protein